MMNEKEFLDIFSVQRNLNSYYQEFTLGKYNIIESQIFISSLVDVMLFVLNSNGSYIPPIDDFDEVEYMKKLVFKLKRMSVEDFKGCLFLDKTFLQQDKNSEKSANLSNQYAKALMYNLCLERANNIGLNVANLISSDISKLEDYANRQIFSQELPVRNLGDVYKGHNAYDWIRKRIDFLSQKGINKASELSNKYSQKCKYVPSALMVFVYGQAAASLAKGYVTFYERAASVIPVFPDFLSKMSAVANFRSAVLYDIQYRSEERKEKKEEKKRMDRYRRNFMANVIWKLKKYLYENGIINKQKLYDMLVFANSYKSLKSL